MKLNWTRSLVLLLALAFGRLAGPSPAAADIVNAFYVPTNMAATAKGNISGQDFVLNTTGYHDSTTTMPATLYLQEMIFIGAPDGTASASQYLNLFTNHTYSGAQINLAGATLVGSSVGSVAMPINSFQTFTWTFDNLALVSNALYAATWYTTTTPGTSFTAVRVGGFVNPGSYPGGRTTTAATTGGDTWFYAITTTAQQDFNTQNITTDTTLAGTFNNTVTYSRTGFRKTGAAALICGSGSTVNLTGDHIIEAGRVRVTTGGSTGSGMIDLAPQQGVSQMLTASGGTLEFNPVSAADTLTFANVIKGVGAVEKTGAGVTILTASNVWRGGLAISNGTLEVGNGSVNTARLGAGPIFIDAPATLSLNLGNAAGVPEFSNNIAGTGTMFVKGNAQPALVGSNAFSGSLLISNGTLALRGINAVIGAPRVAIGPNGNLALGRDFANQMATISELSGSGGVNPQFDANTGVKTLHVKQSSDTAFSGMMRNSLSFITDSRVLALTKSGAGRLTLSGTNIYTGPTIVSNGMLHISGSISNTAVTVYGGTLSGNGSIGGAVAIQSGGTLAPGSNSIGTLTINSNVTLGGTVLMEISKAGATLTADKISAALAVAYGGTLTVTALGDALTGGEVFDLFDGGSFSNSFAQINLPSLTGPLNWYTGGLLTDGTLVVNRAPIASNIVMGTDMNRSADLAVDKLLVQAGDPDGDALVLVNFSATSTNGGTISAITNNGAAYLQFTPAAGFSGSDRFSYTVSDDRGATATADVEVMIRPSSYLGSNQVGGIVLANGEARMTFAGIPGYSYALVRTTNLVNWDYIITNAVPSGGLLDLADPAPPAGQAFYKTEWISTP